VRLPLPKPAAAHTAQPPPGLLPAGRHCLCSGPAGTLRAGGVAVR